MYSNTIWRFKEYDKLRAEKLRDELNIGMPLAILFNQRGLDSEEDVKNFLSVSLENLSDPFVLSGMHAAVERITRAIETGEKVIIYGDYDVDGICSVVLLKKCLKFLGCDADYYVPDRFNEGYGLSRESIEKLGTMGYTLLITVDCGITSIDEVNRAAELGLDIIITDHHTPSQQIPSAAAVINPRLDDDKNARDLCGAGVALKLAWALCRKQSAEEEKMKDWLDLAALATVADIVPLLGDNRILVKQGLKQIENTDRIGLKALLAESGLEGKEVLPWHVGFVLAPRLNSAGRLKTAQISIELLLEEDEEKAADLASVLCELNNERRQIEEQIFKEAVLKVEMEFNLEQEPVLVIAGDKWHQGVIGIVASRLCEKYNRPAILISWDEETGKGSVRSIQGIDIYEVLCRCSQYLVQFGGHKMAAGLSINRNNYELFRQAICNLVREMIPGEQPEKVQIIDIELEINDINENLVKDIELLQPYGEGNPAPCFAMRGSEITSAALVGKGKEHFKARIGYPGMDAIAFNRPEFANLPLNECYYDILFKVEENEFQGKKSIQLKLRDMKPAFKPDNNLETRHFPREMTSMMGKMLQELSNNRPVMLIYPTCRSLVKHQMILENNFRCQVIQSLHGKLPPQEHMKIAEDLQRGAARIFLVTRAYLKYYLRKNHLPPALRYIFQLWQDEIDNNLREAINEKEIEVIIIKGRQAENLNWDKQEWDYQSTGRTIIYANRSATVKRLASELSGMAIEAGVGDKRQRRAMRRKFSESDTGILLLDGGYAGGHYQLDNIDELVFADVPFSSYETLSVLDQIAAAREVQVVSIFNSNDLDLNRSYLDRLYPNLQVIKSVLLYFKKIRKKTVIEEESKIADSIGKYISKEFKLLDLRPILHILTDLGLCQVKKKGSIIEIKFVDMKNPILDISDSPYYLEGMAEKRAYSEWEKKIINSWYGDEYGNSSRRNN